MRDRNAQKLAMPVSVQILGRLLGGARPEMLLPESKMSPLRAEFIRAGKWEWLWYLPMSVVIGGLIFWGLCSWRMGHEPVAINPVLDDVEHQVGIFAGIAGGLIGLGLAAWAGTSSTYKRLGWNSEVREAFRTTIYRCKPRRMYATMIGAVALLVLLATNASQFIGNRVDDAGIAHWNYLDHRTSIAYADIVSIEHYDAWYTWLGLRKDTTNIVVRSITGDEWTYKSSGGGSNPSALEVVLYVAARAIKPVHFGAVRP